MPLVFVPESTYAPAPSYGHSQHYHPYQQPAPSFYESDFARQPYPQPPYLSATPAPREPVHHHVHPRQTASFDPIEAHKQRLIAEYAQQLEHAYPSQHQHAARQHEVRQPEPSAYELERIRYLEAQLPEQRLRKQLEVERARLVEARKEEQRREYEQAIRKQREQQENQIREARLQQQRRLIQQQQLRQAAAAEQEHRQRQLVCLHAQKQHQQQQRQARPQHSLEGLEQLFGLLGGCEPAARREAERPRSTSPLVQNLEHAQEQPSGGFEQFFAQFAQALEHGEADTQQPTPQAATKPTATRSASPSGSSTSRSSLPNKVNKALPPSPLTTLRSLHAKFVGLTAAKETTPHLAHQLEQLLLAADGVEADGNELVRSERKKLVREVESALEGLEDRKVGVPVVAKEKVAEQEEVIAPAFAAQEVATETEIAPIAVAPAQDAPSAVAAHSSDAPVAEAVPISEDTTADAPISPTPTSTPSSPIIAPAVIPAVPTLATPTPTSDTAAPEDHLDSDASSIASLSGSDADSGFSSDSGSVSAPPAKDKKTRKGRKAPSVEDWEKEEERYEFV